MITENLWVLVNNIFSNPVIERFFRTSLNMKLEKTIDNEEEIRYEGQGPECADGTRIDNISVIRRRNQIRPIIDARISGRCIKVEEIKEIFKNVELINLPLHGSPDATAKYESKTDNGIISFLVNARTRCVSSLAIMLETQPG
jgi:hypothetical protein